MQGDFDLRGTIQELNSPAALGELFARLGYATEQPRPLTPASLQLSAGAAEGVREIRQVAVGHDKDRFRIHFYHLQRVNRAILRSLTTVYNGLEGETLLIVTSDWERIDVVLPRGKQLLVQTLNRLRPSQVHQRFVAQLRWRGPTFADQASYLAKVFETAEWADELFNNRALFSNHVLETRLRERPEWSQVPEVYWRDLARIFREPREDRRTVQVLEKLGFEWPGNQSDILYGPGGAVALFEVAAWGRPLDVRDSAEDEVAAIPGIRAVARLEKAEDGPGWLILTNGELWRLYSRDAHSRATNYYEIDLNGLLAGTGPGEAKEALRYFWVLFRREAFEKSLESDRAGQRAKESLLDWLFRESIDYAKKLGDRLKDKVFEDVFSILAEGFLAADTRPRPLNVEALDEAFRGTLTFLYRLLFLFYAESRDLLPVREHRDYYQKSLRKLCEEVAERAGAAQSDFDRKLREAYRVDRFELFERLRELFRIIDRGSAEHNVPAYNGGLFLTEPDASDARPEAEAARFLNAHPLHDRALARALDRLARDEDARRAELVKVDYRSLGVRQLGSIYEGLLEFRLREAHEPLAIVKGKKTEEVVRLSEALQDKLKILKVGKGKEAVERILQPGTFYLENDRGERRATGSFYTPDFVVEYIVEKAVGPLLDEKLEGFREKLREAERWRIRQKKQAPAKGEDPQKYESGPAVEGQFASLVKDFFEFKVLDPAMGSGHFLVEAVDFITDRMLRFLSQFPWNPVSCHLAELRKEISAALTKQGITVNESRLTDVNLLKRHVLKRCIYGVDRNPMAVELAKVSLWLDCFTLGAPLSFLDHHLRCGNSLLGAEVEEVRQKVDSQLRLWGSSFAGLQLAKASMVLVGGLPDVTTEQIHQSQTAFEAATQATLPFRRILDLYLSGSFLKEAAKPGKKQAKGDSEVVTFLQTQGHDVLGEIDPERFKARLAVLPPAVRTMVEEGLVIAQEKEFFHWELEFSEAFWATAGASDPGFDVVLGNPPYDQLAEKEIGADISGELAFFNKAPSFAAAGGGKLNLYELFICRAATSLVKRGGALSYIVPMALLGDKQTAGIRKVLLDQMKLENIEVFPQKDDSSRRVFPEAKLATVIFSCKKAHPGKFRLRVHSNRAITNEASALIIDNSGIEAVSPDLKVIPICSSEDYAIVEKIATRKGKARFGDYFPSHQGEVNETTDKRFLSSSEADPRILRGANLSRYCVREASQGEAHYLLEETFVDEKSRSLRVGFAQEQRVGFQRSAPQNNYRRLIAARIEPGNYCFDTVGFISDSEARLELELALALLNSELFEFCFRIISTNSKINEYQLEGMPFPERLGPGGDASASAELVSLIRQLEAIESRRSLINRTERSVLAPDSIALQAQVDALVYDLFGLDETEVRHVRRRLAVKL